MGPWSSADDLFLDATLELSRIVTSVTYWKRVCINIKPVRLQLHEEILWALLNFENSCYSSNTPDTNQIASSSSIGLYVGLF